VSAVEDSYLGLLLLPQGSRTTTKQCQDGLFVMITSSIPARKVPKVVIPRSSGCSNEVVNAVLCESPSMLVFVATAIPIRCYQQWARQMATMGFIFKSSSRCRHALASGEVEDIVAPRQPNQKAKLDNVQIFLLPWQLCLFTWSCLSV
jgi:hypothetical protein